jgi:MbtH protein
MNAREGLRMAEKPEASSATQQMTVVVNDEEQYSIWWCGRELPAGWHEAGYRGSAEECLAHISEIWTDMRPRSLREAMEKAAPVS